MENRILNLSSEINLFKQKINICINNLVNKKILSLNYLKNKIKIFNPENILKKGYLIIKINNKIIKNLDEIKENSQINIIFSDGVAKFNICNLKKELNNKLDNKLN